MNIKTRFSINDKVKAPYWGRMENGTVTAIEAKIFYVGEHRNNNREIKYCITYQDPSYGCQWIKEEDGILHSKWKDANE